MKTSRNGILFIARREALVLVAYQDGPHKSIGFGSNSPDLKEGDTITVPEAFARLRKDIAEREVGLNRRLKVPVEQHQYDALMSLHYQSGNRYLATFTGLINDGKPEEAADLFPVCDANLAGEPLLGLRKRRVVEQRLFRTGEYGDINPIPMWRGNPRETTAEWHYVTEEDLPDADSP